MPRYTVVLTLGDIEAPDKEAAAATFLSALNSGYPLQFKVKPEPGLFEWVTLTPKEIAVAFEATAPLYKD